MNSAVKLVRIVDTRTKNVIAYTYLPQDHATGRGYFFEYETGAVDTVAAWRTTPSVEIFDVH